ncbi:MAG TPA: hypothetical protein PLP88_03865 [Bacteroidales bacterium]|nr:hypothetical protein [Bacteroidales bacterium]
MKNSFILLFLVITSRSIAQDVLHSYVSSFSANPALTDLDSSSRLNASFSSIACYSKGYYADLCGSTNFKHSRYGMTGYVRMFDYGTGCHLFRPLSTKIDFISTYLIKNGTQETILKPSLGIGLTFLSLVSHYSTNEPIYKVNEEDCRFRYSASVTIFNDKINAGLSYVGINRPDYKASKATPWLASDRIFGISFSNLFIHLALKRRLSNAATALFAQSGDKFPRIYALDEHYVSYRRLGCSYSKTKFLLSASFGLLNDNFRFKEYKADLLYRFKSFDFGIKVIYCDEPANYNDFVFHSVIQPFPLTNMTMINYSLTYHFNKKRAHYSNWANILVF